MEPKTVMFMIRIPEKLRFELKKKCIERRLSMQYFVNEAIVDKLKDGKENTNEI